MIIHDEHGILAQLGEHLPYKQGVTGSSPVGPIYKVICKWIGFIENNSHMNIL